MSLYLLNRFKDPLQDAIFTRMTVSDSSAKRGYKSKVQLELDSNSSS